MAKKMGVTQAPAGGPTGLGGEVTDGEDTAGTNGSAYSATLVERQNKAQTRNQTPGRSPLMAKDLGTATKSSRKISRV